MTAFVFDAPSIAIEIPLQKEGGVYTLQVQINGVMTLPFILDSGASEVTIPADVALTLLRSGTINDEDFLPGKKYSLADGSILKGSRFQIRELEVGGFKISNVPALVVRVTGSLLLGQSFLSRLPHWAIDNQRQLLVIRWVPVDESDIIPIKPVPQSDVNFFDGPGIPGLKWGDSPAEARDVMDRCNARIINAYENYNKRAEAYGKSGMEFHGKFMDRDGEATLIFYEHKLYKCTILFDVSKSESAESFYSHLLRILEVKYGPADKTEINKPSRNWQWYGDVTNLYLHQGFFSNYKHVEIIEFSDWKTEKIADEREKQYTRKSDTK